MRAWGGLVGKAKVSVWRKFTPFNFSLFQERSPWELTLEPSRPTQIPRGLGRKGTAFCRRPHSLPRSRPLFLKSGEMDEDGAVS
ncbi:hypothetical protein D623_10029507 [Myotis brandtii]|uniref:Uncharacterized protein n=1 Tax=Myotis brandtii TaxID=109478 RepID=S7PBJ4_MYOBR|nr:hypothetical protein D623_10029507 [Myotis brandtii]